MTLSPMLFSSRLAMCVLASAGVLAMHTTPAEALPLESIFATGVDANGLPLADGVTDPHWVVSNDGGATFLPAINEQNNYCGSCGGIWLEWPQGDNMISRAITHPSFVRVSAPNNVFTWRQAFDVPSNADPASITISYRVGYDDLSRNANDDADLTGCNHTVWLNGTPYDMTASGNHNLTECVATIPAGSNFQTGQNTIEFRISNLATYYGFRLENVSASYEIATVCGDGLVEGNELCDDGNMVDGDGCSSACEVEDGYQCEEPDFVFNGDFELGDTGTGGALSVDPNPLAAPCGAQDFSPRDNYYYVTSSPYHSCTCDGGQGLCLALNGGGVLWSQTLTGLAPNTTYTVSARHALKGEANAALEPKLELVVDGTPLASATPTQQSAPIPYETISATFTTGPAQTTALIEFTNSTMSDPGNDSVLDSISVTGPSVCNPPCGDGILGMGEACDDGNMVSGDGCSASCEVEDGYACMGEPSMCEPLCGNGTLDAGEACDDGNMVSGDGCSAVCLDERVNLPLYSTGVDDTGTPLADGLTDTHWEVSVDGGAFVSALNDKNNYCSSCGNRWIEWPLGDQATSRGITHPDHVRTSAPNRLFVWRQTFTLPVGARPDTATISYRVGYDEFSRNANDDADLTGCNHTVWLNGMPYVMNATGNHFRTECAATIPAGSNFQAGQNTIEFRITNNTTYYGFRLDTIEGTFLLGCGNGVVDADEMCDDGNNDDADGCSATCEVEDGYACADEPSVCTELVCGDGVISSGEDCDDGNTDAGDGCSATCEVEDGFTCMNEPSECMLTVMAPECGDGVIEVGEDCDDGNTDAGDGCSATCEVEDGFTCEEEPSVCMMTQVNEAKCGDGVIQSAETCDDGNVNAGDGCSATCEVEDGYACTGEPSGCEKQMSEPECGDGMVQGNEQCDDGNTDAGDGCSATCQKEEESTEEPGDGSNQGNEGGCSSTGSQAPAGGVTWLLGLLGLVGIMRRRNKK